MDAQTWIRAAALGSEELMRTGWEISMLCLLLSWATLWLTDRAENECRFLAFFFPSPLRWLEPFPLGGEALGEEPRAQGSNGAGSELGPGALAGIGLSISISCFAVSFSCARGKERRGERRFKSSMSNLTASCTFYNPDKLVVMAVSALFQLSAVETNNITTIITACEALCITLSVYHTHTMVSIHLTFQDSKPFVSKGQTLRKPLK